MARTTTKTTSKPTPVQRLVSSLRLAKSRALYWSGNPSLTGRRFQPGRGGRKNHNAEYELAMDDIDNLCRQLEEATGQPWKRYDPKQDFIDRYCRVLSRPRPAA